jgi:hypothetical protein
MPDSKFEPVTLLPPRIHVYGHVSATPGALATVVGGHMTHEVVAESDLALFVINPAAGISPETIELWQALDEFQIPRLIAVTVLDGQELDFDDAVMLINRVLDQVITPYLVLHAENGHPIALIRLSDLEIIDYSTSPPTIRHHEPEHEELVRDFRDEYFQVMSEMDEGAFTAGILFPAIPVNISRGIGIDIVKRYISELPSSS